MSVIEEKPPLDELVHYGVKGMKWGVRRSKTQLSRSGGGEKSKVSNKRKAKIKKAARRTLAVTGAVTAVGVAGVGSYFVGKKIGDAGKFTMDQMNHYAAAHAGRTAAQFIKNDIDFEVSMAHVRNIEKGYRNDMIPGSIKDRRREKKV